MKKIFSISALVLFIFSMNVGSFSQSDNDKDYASKKMQFWQTYLEYKSNLDRGIIMSKPIDPNGLFMIDENNNFGPITRPLGEVNNNNNSAPWIGSKNIVSPWVWSQDTVAYTSIDGGLGTVQVNLTGITDDNNFGPYPIGFAFIFDSVSYSNFGIMANGWISMGPTLPVSSYTPIQNGTINNVIAGLARDLYGNTANGGKLMYQLSGSAPNRVLTVEWKNWGVFSSGLAEYNFQIKLYEGSNLIRVHYGNFSGATTVPLTAFQVGLTGAARTDFNARSVLTSGNWSASTAATLNSDTCRILPPTLIPTNGLRWTWTQPVGGNSMAYVSSNTVQLSSGLLINQNTINNQMIQVQVVTTGAASPFNVTSFSLGTDGSNNPGADITNAKVYYSGAYSTFALANAILYGTFSSPNGTFTVNGNTGLATGTNYFWITYDVPLTAVNFDSVDAQCNTITGSGAMGTVVPTTVAPAGSRPIDIYCRGTVSLAGCPYNIYASNVTLAGPFGSINNTTGCDGILPYQIGNYTGVSTQVRQNNPYSISVAIPSYTNPTGFGIWVDWNNNNLFSDAGEYTATTAITSSGNNPATATINVPPGATIGNHRMRIRANLSTPPTSAQFCTALTYGEQEDYTLAVIADTNQRYISSTSTQTNTSTVQIPSINTQIIGIQVVTDGSITPLNATSFTLNTSGSTNPTTDIRKARLWYTGANPNFATTTQFGPDKDSANGSFSIVGSQSLGPGTNYFWLTYDVPVSANLFDTLDAQCNSITIAGIGRIPTVTSPAGYRVITATRLAGTYTIPGSYAHFADAINDLNNRGTYGPVTFNVQAGFADTVANLVINTSGSASNPIVFQRVGVNMTPNPVIVAGVGVSTLTDGIIKLNGTDYITFDGIDLQENPANTTTTTWMEWGYALLKPDGTNGCQNVTIKNCNITLNKSNINSTAAGIYANNHSPTSTGTFVVNTSAGTNSNNLFLNNNITNVYNGYYISGYADGTVPYTFYDQNNTINGGNITNYGGAATTNYGIYSYYQNNLTITNTTVNNTGGANASSLMYGIYSGLMNNSNLTISNNTVTLTTTVATATLYGIYFGVGSSGTTNNINILNNTVRDFNFTSATTGIMYLIYCQAINNNITISGNRTIGNIYGTAGVSTGTTIYGIYNVSSSLNSVTLTNNLDSGNVVNGTTAYSLYRMYTAVSSLYCTITGNRIVNNTICGTTAAATSYGIYNSTTISGQYTCNISNNTISNNSLPTTLAHSMYMIINSSNGPTQDENNNTISGNTSSGSGTLYCVYYGGAPGFGSTVNMNNNTVTNQSKTTGTGTGSIYGIYQGSSPQGTLNINNNTVTGFTSAAATLFAGIYQASVPGNFININNNRVGNFTNAGASTIYGIYCTATTNTQPTISNDSVFNISSPGSTIYGIDLVSSGFIWNVFKNRISGLTNSTSSSLVYGIYSTLASATTVNIYNNFISDLNAPASAGNPAISGIYIASGASTTYLNLYYNTVYLNAVPTSTTFWSNCLYALTTPVVELKNNIFVNKSTPGSVAGYTVAYRRSSTILTTYSNNSNNNCFYSGTPAANRLIFYDGTNFDQTIAAYRSRVNPRDQVAFTEDVPFVNGTTAPYDLRIQTSTPTGCESGGQVISSPVNITTDAFGTPRYPNGGYPIGGFTPVAPDVGAHEFGGLNADLIPPNISYAALGNGGTSNRSFNNVVITDVGLVNTSPGTKPRCYYKRSTDSNVVNDTTSLTDGWKYVQANGTTSPFDFTIDYSKLVGGGGVSPGTVIQYFVTAQDTVSTPNVGWNQATFAAVPTSVALTSANVPITNTLSYTIVSTTFSGSYNVGAAQTYTTLTGAGGLFASINAGVVSGNITALVTSDLIEDGSNGLNQFNETSPGGYKLTIAPSSGTPRLISGSVAQGMIRLNGADRVVIDGNGGFEPQDRMINLRGDMVPPAKYLTFRNMNGSNPVFTFINDAVRDSIRNCYIESNNINISSGTIFFSTTTGTQGNDSNSIDNCDIRDTSGSGTAPYAQAVYSLGTTTNWGTYNDYNSITNCNIYNYFYDLTTTEAAIQLTSGNSGWTISGNSFYQTVVRSVNNSPSLLNIYMPSTLNNNMTITNNYIGGSTPLCGGSPMTYTGTSLSSFTWYGMLLSMGVLAPTNVQGNVIRNLSLTYNGSSSSTFFRGINPSSGFVNVVGDTIGAPTGNNSILLTLNNTASSFTLLCIVHTGIGSVSNNTIGSITSTGNATSAANSLQGIQFSNTTTSQTYNCNNNLIGSLSTPNSIWQRNPVTGNSDRGILFGMGTGTTVNCFNNTIGNWTDSSTSSVNQTSVYGIQNGSAGFYNFTGNVVRNLTNYSNYPLLPGTFFLGGIFSTGTGQNTFNQNLIYSLYGLGPSATYSIGGILAGGTYGGTVTRNKIFDFKFLGTGTPAPTVMGINCQSTGIYTHSNNMVSLTNGDATFSPEMFKHEKVQEPEIQQQSPRLSDYHDGKPVTPEVVKAFEGSTLFGNNAKQPAKSPNLNPALVDAQLVGIFHSSTSPGPCNYYYNTIYVGGTQPGAGAYYSTAFLRLNSGNIFLRDNLFINARSGGLGNQYCVSNQAAIPASGWTPTSSNYNVLLGSNASTIGEWGAGNAQSISQWRISSGGDNQTWSTTTGTVNPSSLLTNITTCDLTIQTGNAAAWLVSGKGIAITGQSIDFNGNPRVTTISGGCTDIGAHEFAATPPSNPLATESGAPGAGVTTSYTLYGRTICAINWGVGGSFYPTSMNVNYFSGINPPNLNTFSTNYSNSNWVITIGSGTFSGSTYDITFSIGDNETYTITSPSTNTILGKNDLYYTVPQWVTYAPGAGALQSELNWAALTIKTRGLSTFSTFALSDAAIPPSPILVNPPNNSVGQPLSLTLIWRPSAGAASYKVQLATDSTFNSGLVVNDSTITDTTRAVSGLILNTNYYWRVRGKNATGIGAYSAVFKFDTYPPGAPPPPPVLFSPPNNAVGQPLALTLVWYRSTTAITYRVQVATDTGFTSLIVNDSTLTDSTRAISGLSPLTFYYWRVNAKNSFGTSTYSTVFNFKTVGPPTQVTLLNPPNNATNQPLSLQFRWSKAVDQTSPFGSDGKINDKNGEAEAMTVTNYWWEMTTDTLVNQQRDTTLTDTTKSVSGLSYSTVYFWKVRAKNQLGWGPFSVWFKFTTIPIPPPAPPALSSPANNSVGQPLALNLIWFRSATATGYWVQLSTDSTFGGGFIVNDSTITDSIRAVSGLSPLTYYWWRVNAKNSSGFGGFSAVWKFKTMGPPTQVTLLNPPNNATNQPISLQFRWSRAVDQTSPFGGDEKINDKNGKAEVLTVTNYWWELRTDTTLSNLQIDSTLTDTTKSVSGLSYSTTYFWRVRAKNQLGWGPFSVWFRFTTMPPPPAIVNLTVIPGGFYNTGTQQLNMKDTIRVYLVDSVSCLRVDSTRGVLDSVTFSIPNASFSIANTGNYYIFVYHRNHLTIASRFRQNIIRGSTVAYDFTTDSAKAYGFNMIKVSTSPVRWGMIPGDANQDGFVDGLDQTIWIGQNGLDGYLSADFNGDTFVDGLDQTIWILMNGTSTFLPCGFQLWNPTERTKMQGDIQLKFLQQQNTNTKENGNR